MESKAISHTYSREGPQNGEIFTVDWPRIEEDNCRSTASSRRPSTAVGGRSNALGCTRKQKRSTQVVLGAHLTTQYLLKRWVLERGIRTEFILFA